MKRGKKRTLVSLILTMLMMVGLMSPMSFADITKSKPNVEIGTGIEVWSQQFGEIVGGYATGGSTPPLVTTDAVFVGDSNRLVKMDKETGEIIKESADIVKDGISYNNNYAQIAPAASSDENTIYLAVTRAIGNGQAGIAAFDADTLNLKWISLHGEEGSSATTPILVEGDKVYAGTSKITYDASWNENIVAGTFSCMNPDGTLEWSENISGESFYGGGAVVVNGYTYFGGDSGKLYRINNSTGGREELAIDNSSNAKIRSTPVADEAEENLYFTASDGNLYRYYITSNSAINTKVGFASSSTPIVNGDTVYVGVNGGFGAKGAIKALDATTLTEKWAIETDGAQLGDMVLYDGETYESSILYATINDSKGGIFGIEIALDGSVVESGYVFTPDVSKQNYSTSLIALDEGDLYYKNDLNIFRIGAEFLPNKPMVSGLEEGGKIVKGDKIQLRCKAYKESGGDYLYIPYSWKINPTGTFEQVSQYTYAATIDTSSMKVGNQNLQVTYAVASLDGTLTGEYVTQNLLTFEVAATSLPENVPNTGENANIFGMMMLLLASIVGLGVVTYRKKFAR